MGFVTNLFGADEAKRAADAQRQGYQQAGQTIQAGGDSALDRYAPYAQTGQTANRMIQDVMDGDFSSFYESPDYQFRLEQGEQALERGAAARGMNLSGATLKDLNRFGQGLASTEYGNWYNRLVGQQGLGANVAGAQAGIDQDTASGVANTQIGAAGARASGYMADANIKNSLMSGITNAVTGYGASWLPQPS
ncbi:hypothetical protein [Microbulbifer celer]|uniref:DNA transfer protein p32 n=1 Tax=Microbulbifer celer TaxID=435905 RepID=A0ABW3U6E3_9GAMM|nr:hypothetical protein [Microbulbifer celer]UFN58586.1 hypothetical protein LPW13_05955 [Microbulbifer celer]